jgi:hypothetical protein
VLPPDDPNKPFVNREPSIDPPRLKPPLEAPSEKPGITEPPKPRAGRFGMSALVQGRRRMERHSRFLTMRRALRTGLASRAWRRTHMAKYGKKAQKTVESAMRRRKRGTLRSSSGQKVTSREQAVAIGLSEARKKGAKVPARPRA